MKKVVTVLVLLAASIPSYGVDGKALLTGFGIGVTVQIIPWTRNHVIMPPLKAAQRTIRPIPQDKIDKANRKAEKERRKRERKTGKVASETKS